jgi:hypothetical protein
LSNCSTILAKSVRDRVSLCIAKIMICRAISQIEV